MLTNHIHTFAYPLLYLDPGSGSFILQLLLGVLLGAGVAIKIYWAKIKTFFASKRAETVNTSEKIDEE